MKNLKNVRFQLFFDYFVNKIARFGGSAADPLEMHASILFHNFRQVFIKCMKTWPKSPIQISSASWWVRYPPPGRKTNAYLYFSNILGKNSRKHKDFVKNRTIFISILKNWPKIVICHWLLIKKLILLHLGASAQRDPYLYFFPKFTRSIREIS